MGDGYTFIEVLVAAALLGFLVFSLYTTFSFGFATVALSQENLRADQILVQKLETLRVYNWTNIVNNYIPTNFPEWFSETGGVNYDGSLSISPFVPSTANETYSDTLRQVTVSVQWISGRVARTRSMTTLVSQYGIQTYKP